MIISGDFPLHQIRSIYLDLEKVVGRLLFEEARFSAPQLQRVHASL